MKRLLCDELADPLERRMQNEDLMGALIVVIVDADGGAQQTVRAHPALLPGVPRFLRELADALERGNGN